MPLRPIRWLEILSFFIGAVGLFLYFHDRRQREPVLVIGQVRTPIFTAGSTQQSAFRVVAPSGAPMETDISALNVYFWNEGRESIRPINVLSPIKIKLTTEKCRILDVKKLYATRDSITQMQLRNIDSVGSRELMLNFAILEERDGGTWQVIYSGDPNASFSMEGIVEGYGEIRTTSPTSTKRIVGVGILLVAYVIFMWFLLDRLIRAVLMFFQTRRKPEPSEKELAVARVIIIFIIISVAAYIALDGRLGHEVFGFDTEGLAPVPAVILPGKI